MGYGHERAAIALREYAYGGIIHADAYPKIPASDKKIWREQREMYEAVSRVTRVPFAGNALFRIVDHFQAIADFYPRRDLSRPTLQLRALFRLMRKHDWGKHLVETLNKKPLPLIATFFTMAHMAEYFGYRGEIYCTVTDTDCSRAWVGLNPKKSRIRYLAPTFRVVERLQMYGVARARIYLTGFPLPKENGDGDFSVIAHDISNRIVNLDPKRTYRKVHGNHVRTHLKLKTLPARADHPLTLTFAVGGAGAQRNIGVAVLKSLASRIAEGAINLTLVAGTHQIVRDYFMRALTRAGLRGSVGKGVRVLFSKSKEQYFRDFNRALHTTDILWTKPSELSFYAALGIPIIVAPPIGSQEVANQEWLRALGAGVLQEDPTLTHEWLFDWLRSGLLAKAAIAGFREGPRLGTYNIGMVLANHAEKIEPVATVASV